jgi:hypothetical protein
MPAPRRATSHAHQRSGVEFAPAYGQKLAKAIASMLEFAQQKFQKAVPVED